MSMDDDGRCGCCSLRSHTRQNTCLSHRIPLPPPQKNAHAQNGDLVALATREGGGGFDDYGGQLEIRKLEFASQGTVVKGSVKTSGRFTSLAWSALYNKRADFPLGVVAGHAQPRIAAVQRHTGPVNGLHFNPTPGSSHLLASGGADNEVFVLALDRPDAPNVFIPAPAPNTAKHTAEVAKYVPCTRPLVCVFCVVHSTCEQPH